METYMIKARNNLNYAKDELEEIINILEENILINDTVFQEQEINKIISKIKMQNNNLKYNIIPEIRKM